MKVLKHLARILGILLLFTSLMVCFLWLYLPRAAFSVTEDPGRIAIVTTAERYLGTEEDSIDHHFIIDTYNAHLPLAQGYTVQYDDDWCATFVSVCAIKSNQTHIIPTECSCQRQIGRWKELGRWEERDYYQPVTGDVIYYDWDVRTPGDSTGWADHVGIVVGTWGPFIKVIEGNMDDTVGHRYLIRWDPRIRGYGLPDY